MSLLCLVDVVGNSTLERALCVITIFITGDIYLDGGLRLGQFSPTGVSPILLDYKGGRVSGIIKIIRAGVSPILLRL